MSINGLTVGRGAGNIGTNTASGYNALNKNTTGRWNTASGAGSLQNNTTGQQNTAFRKCSPKCKYHRKLQYCFGGNSPI